MNVIQTLGYLGYEPNADYVADWLNGAVVVSWRVKNPPTQAEIDAAIIPAAKAAIRGMINAEATRRILAVYPLEKQSSANIGLYPQAYRDQMAEDIAAVIQASNDACDLVNAAVDEAGIDAVVPNWPVIGG